MPKKRRPVVELEETATLTAYRTAYPGLHLPCPADPSCLIDLLQLWVDRHLQPRTGLAAEHLGFGRPVELVPVPSSDIIHDQRLPAPLQHLQDGLERAWREAMLWTQRADIAPAQA